MYGKFFVLLAISIASADGASADAVKVVGATRTLAADNGRFVFGQISDARRDQYMLDTQTGQLWQVVERSVRNAEGPGSTTYMALQPVPYSDSAGRESSKPSLSLDEGFGEWLKTKPPKK